MHQWRVEEHAILVGANTVLQDDPRLTVREAVGQTPIRIVLDKNNSLSRKFQVFNEEAETIVLNEVNPKKVLSELYSKNIQSVIIEGGSKTLQSFIEANLWDEARIFVGDVEFENGIKAPLFEAKTLSELKIETDILKIHRND